MTKVKQRQARPARQSLHSSAHWQKQPATAHTELDSNHASTWAAWPPCEQERHHAHCSASGSASRRCPPLEDEPALEPALEPARAPALVPLLAFAPAAFAPAPASTPPFRSCSMCFSSSTGFMETRGSRHSSQRGRMERHAGQLGILGRCRESHSTAVALPSTSAGRRSEVLQFTQRANRLSVGGNNGDAGAEASGTSVRGAPPRSSATSAR